MAKVERFEDLLVWKEARTIAIEVYRNFKDQREYGFKDQMQRAAVSIMNNIAEEFERGTDADLVRFLYIAKSSAGEVRSMLYLATDLGYIDKINFDELKDSIEKLSSGLSNFIKYLKKPKK